MNKSQCLHYFSNWELQQFWLKKVVEEKRFALSIGLRQE